MSSGLNFEPPESESESESKSDDDDDFGWLSRRDGPHRPVAASQPQPSKKVKPKKKKEKKAKPPPQQQQQPPRPVTKAWAHPSAHSLTQPLNPFVDTGLESAPPKPRRRPRRSR